MNKEQAEKILNLPKRYTDKELEDAYRRQRDVYYPPLHELFGKHDEENVKNQMFEQMTDYSFSYPVRNHKEGPSGSEMAQYAFICFSDVCDAYHILKGDQDYIPYRLDANDFDGYLLERFGKVGGVICKILAKLSRYTLWFLIPLAIAWIWAAAEEKLSIGILASGLFVALHWGIPFLLDPFGFLLYLPKGLWEGIECGAQYGLLITKLYSIMLCSCGFLIWWIIKFVFRPCLIIDDLEFGLGEKIHFKRHCRSLLQKRYDRAKEQVEQFGEEFMADKVRQAYLAYQSLGKWNPEKRKAALEEVLAVVQKNNPQYKATMERARHDIFELNSLKASFSREDERASKWIEWVSYDQYSVGPILVSSRDDDMADRLYQKYDENHSGRYDYLEEQRMHFILDQKIAQQRQFLECCIAVYDQLP